MRHPSILVGHALLLGLGLGFAAACDPETNGGMGGAGGAASFAGKGGKDPGNVISLGGANSKGGGGAGAASGAVNGGGAGSASTSGSGGQAGNAGNNTTTSGGVSGRAGTAGKSAGNGGKSVSGGAGSAGVSTGQGGQQHQGGQAGQPHAGAGGASGAGAGSGQAGHAGAAGGGNTARFAVQVVTGLNHSCVRFVDGAVRCWGKNQYGQLGRGDTVTIGDDEPASAGRDVALGRPATQLAAGQDVSCAVLDNGAARCWGRGDWGTLGYAATEHIGDNETPTQDVQLGAGSVQMISTQGGRTCVLMKTSGAVRCWGMNASGELGYGHVNTIGDNEHPSSAGDVAIGGKAIWLGAEGTSTCVVLEGGNARCWGYAGNGAIGGGTTRDIGDNETPDSVPVINLGGTAATIASGADHTCALLVNGAVRCFGWNPWGQLGYGHANSIGDNEAPATAGDVPLGGATVTQLTAGNGYTCALLSGGAARCWGNIPTIGYPGLPSHWGDEASEIPLTKDLKLGGRAVQISAHHAHTCAVLDTGRVRCWGVGANGALGYGNKQEIGDDEDPQAAGDVPL